MLQRLFDSLPHIYKRKYANFLTIVLTAISIPLNNFEEDYAKIIGSCSIITAEGFWLDFWGFLFGIKRFIGENDFNYRKRLLIFVKYGANTVAAIYKTLKFYYGDAISLEENFNGITKNNDYSTYDYNFDSCIVILQYSPQFVSSLEKTFFVNKSYIGSNSYIIAIDHRYSQYQVKDIIGNLKVAGVKFVHDIN